MIQPLNDLFSQGGVWVPQDGTISPLDLLHTLASESRKNGINIIENCEVTKVLVRETRGGQYYKVRGVETTRGTIECDIFVNCAGIVSNSGTIPN